MQVPEKREQLKGDVGLFGLGGEPEVLERQDLQSSWEGLGPEVGLIEEFDISFDRNIISFGVEHVCHQTEMHVQKRLILDI